MQLLIYAGHAPSRDAVLQFTAPIVQQVATGLTLVAGGGSSNTALLEDAIKQLSVPESLPVTLRALSGNAQEAIRSAVQERAYDLVSFGRLRPPIRRWLPGQRSKTLTQRLEPSVLRVQGMVRPLCRILLASGGDAHTFADVALTARVAQPLGATVTLLHVLLPDALFVEGRARRQRTVEEYLADGSPEAGVMQRAVAQLKAEGVPTQLIGRAGPVLDEIMAELEHGDYDLLVIGAHQVASALDRILLEDITGDLLERSPRPVLVVKGDEGA
ncbi:MAG: universal stress protein [Herpetosiphonaceae bacterium]|nr:universal stress protein [Herpetosiphonaceae bacterium]